MPSPDLDAIIEQLVEEFVAEKVDLEHDASRETFRLNTLRVTTFPEFLEAITRFYLHHFAHTVTRGRLPVEFATGLAQEVAHKCFPGGIEEAFLNAATGGQGGLKGVIDRMAERLKNDHREKWQSHVLSTQFDPLKWEDAESLAQQFLARHGNRLPPGTQQVNVGMIAAKIRQHITEMAEAVSRVRRAIQRRY